MLGFMWGSDSRPARETCGPALPEAAGHLDLLAHRLPFFSSGSACAVMGVCFEACLRLAMVGVRVLLCAGNCARANGLVTANFAAACNSS